MKSYNRDFQRYVLLNLINAFGPISRTKLMEMSGFRLATVGEIAKELLDEGLAVEAGLSAHSTGRRRPTVDLNRRAICAVGISIAHNRATAVLARLDGTIVREEVCQGDPGCGHDALTELIARCVERLLADVGDMHMVGIGIGDPLVDPAGYQKGSPISANYRHFNDWVHLRLNPMLEARFGLPVRTLSAVTLPALVERQYGTAKGSDNFICVELSNGIASLHGTPEAIIPASFLLSWGGLSVHFQTLSLLQRQGLDARLYLPGKALQACISAALACLLLRLCPTALTAAQLGSAALLAPDWLNWLSAAGRRTVLLSLPLWGGLAARLAGVPAVVNAVSGLGVLFSGEEPSFMARMVLRVMRFSNHRDNVSVIFQNHEDMDLFLHYHIISEDACVFIKGSGVDLKEFHYTPEPDDKHIQIIFTARMVKEKGIVSEGFQCRSFRYDPLQRIPPQPAHLDFSNLKEEDFSL